MVPELGLLAGYGTAFCLLVLYFVWEGGPLHCSRRVESITLTAVLFIFYGCSFVWAHLGIDGWTGTPYGVQTASGAEHAAAQFRQLSRLLVLMMILQVSVVPQAHARFADGLSESSARRAAIRSLGVPPPHAKRIASELDSVISETLKKSSLRGAGFCSERLGPPALFMLLMVEEVVVSTSYFDNASVVKVMVYLEVFFLCAWIILETRRWFQLGGLYTQIHDSLSGVVRAMEKETLNFILVNISVGTLIEVGMRKTIDQIHDLALEAGMLNLVSKAVLVHALQQRGMRHSRHSQKAVWRIMASCHRQELTTLKNLLDSSEGHLNLHKLVFEDLSVQAIQADMLGHFAVQAGRMWEASGSAYGVKVLSDIDDTLFSSGGKFPAGCDIRYPRHAVYPGCLTFLQSVGLCGGGSGSSQERAAVGNQLLQIPAASLSNQRPETAPPPGKLVFVSARPHLYKDWSEDHSYRMFKSLLAEGRLHTAPTLLPGTLRNGLVGTLTGKCLGARAWRRVGEAKFTAYVRFQALYPEYDFVFCGDDGQGDLLAAQRMMGRGAHKQPLAALIHRVLPGGPGRALALDAGGDRGERWVASLAAKNIFLHRGYLSAAVELRTHRPCVIPALALVAVAESAVQELHHLSDDTDGLFREAWRDLSEDLERADALVQETGLPPLPELDVPGVPAASRRRSNTSAGGRRFELSWKPGSRSPRFSNARLSGRDIDLRSADAEECGSASKALQLREHRRSTGVRRVMFLDRALSELRKVPVALFRPSACSADALSGSEGASGRWSSSLSDATSHLRELEEVFPGEEPWHCQLSQPAGDIGVHLTGAVLGDEEAGCAPAVAARPSTSPKSGVDPGRHLPSPDQVSFAHA